MATPFLFIALVFANTAINQFNPEQLLS